jgi:Tol biopolymer transport system component
MVSEASRERALAPMSFLLAVCVVPMVACHEILPFEFSGADASTAADADAGPADRSLVDTGGDALCPWGDFSAPERVPTINSSTDDWCPWLTADGLQIYFKSWRGVGQGNGDIWRADRADRAMDFGQPVPVTELNTPAEESCLSLTADAAMIFFSRGETDARKDLWVATRTAPDAPFGPPTVLTELASPAEEDYPRIDADGVRVVFSSVGGGTGEWNIWFAERRERGERFGAPVLLAEVNSSYNDRGAFISANRLELYFHSNRPGGLGMDDLWMARRDDPDGPFAPPTLLTALNTDRDDAYPYLSPDGTELYYNRATDTSGANPDPADIWMAKRSSVPSLSP